MTIFQIIYGVKHLKLTVKRKLMGGFLIVCVLLLFISTLSIIYMKQIDNSYSDIVDRRAEIRANMKDVVNQALTQNLNVRGILLMNDQASMDNRMEAHKKINVIIEETKGFVTIPANKEALNKIQETNQLYEKNFEAFMEYAKTHNSKDQISYWKANLVPVGKQIIDQADEFALMSTQVMHEASAKNTETVKSIITTVMILSIFTLVLSMIIGYVISIMISKPLERITQATEQMAVGDLTIEEIRVKNKDELGVLANSFNQMVTAIRNLIKQVNNSTEQVAASSEELMASAEQTTHATEQISTSIQEVANGADTQGKNVEESARAIQEITIGVQRVASATSTVADETKETIKEAKEGNESIQKVIHQMDKIQGSVHDTATVIQHLEERSKEIGKIIDVITGISSQTNLLALNAAIEAARAGEHGKGFAVVADEVKKLAEQSKESADQITTLVEEIQGDTERAVTVMRKGTNEVELGITVVQETGEGFKRILQSIDQVSSQIQEISAVSEEMSAGVEQVNASMEQVAYIAKNSSANTQNVAAASEEQLASMEEITASSTSLSKMSEELLIQTRQFKL